MLLLKKYIHLFWKKKLIQNNLLIFSNSLYIFYFKTHFNLILFSNCFQNQNYKKLQASFLIIYKLFFFIKTKHLFLFTIYLIYTKLLKIFTTFNFMILTKKIKKITILRAPCYHKNSKEQYGLDFYKGLIQSKFIKNNYKFYNLYVLNFLNHNKLTFLTKYWYILKKNEKKYIE